MLHSSASRLVGVVAGLVLAISLAPAVLAKEGVEVTLAAPIPADAQPGDVVAVFFTLTGISDQGPSPLRGSPVFIRIHGPNGAVTQADGVEQRTPGTYKAMVEIPAGGAARAEFGLHGSTTDANGRTTPSDIVWRYDGLLVAAQPPAAVDPNDFQLPTEPKTGVIVPKYATEPVPLPANPTPAPAASSLDPRAAGLAALALVLAVAAGIVLRRRILPTTA